MQKTPDKAQDNPSENSEVTPEKLAPLEEEINGDSKTNSVSLKGVAAKNVPKIKVEKSEQSELVNHSVNSDDNKNKTPEKSTPKDHSDVESNQVSCDKEDGMISSTEQARLLIAANKTPSKCVNRTPVKHRTTNGKRSVESSPTTPGKYKRVDLITLASPKAKRIKQM